MFLELINSLSDDANDFIIQEYKYLPVPSNIANLHPLEYPGSKPSTLWFLIGGVINKFSKFLSKISIASLEATSESSLLISLSILGSINLA